ncbi:MAG: hypothetical protein JJE35_05520 [Thermoleophilia bacterium]|nr:hypothetical protein [Thermoleophilia bacterium]
MGGEDDSWTTKAADLATESTVMRQVLAVHPILLTLPELIREIAGEDPGFAERDALERAVRDLGGVGLLHRQGEFVVPTRAALHFSELLDR